MPHRLLLDGTNYLSLDGTNRLVLDATPIASINHTVPAFTQVLTMGKPVLHAVISQTINPFTIPNSPTANFINFDPNPRAPGVMRVGGRPRRAL